LSYSQKERPSSKRAMAEKKVGGMREKELDLLLLSRKKAIDWPTWGAGNRGEKEVKIAPAKKSRSKGRGAEWTERGTHPRKTP